MSVAVSGGGAPDPRAPIGVFDSGVGGLSVLAAIRRALPFEHLVYVADSAHAPYGDRDPGFIVDRASTITRWLRARDAKAIVIACNTASALALDALRAGSPVPVIGLEPAIAPATRQTRTGVVAVLATTRTIAGPSVEQLCATWGRDTRILLQACPGLVERIESGDVAGDATRRLLEHFLAPLLAARADVLVLGCTHFAFVAPLIREIAGRDVTVIDSADAVARQLARRLHETDCLSPSRDPARIAFYTNDETGTASRVLQQLWDAPIVTRQPSEHAGANHLAERPEALA